MSMTRDEIMPYDGMTGYYGMCTRPQHRYRVEMQGDVNVSVTVMAGSASSVIDQVHYRRIATPPNMKGFTVSQIDDQIV